MGRRPGDVLGRRESPHWCSSGSHPTRRTASGPEIGHEHPTDGQWAGVLTDQMAATREAQKPPNHTLEAEGSSSERNRGEALVGASVADSGSPKAPQLHPPHHGGKSGGTCKYPLGTWVSGRDRGEALVGAKWDLHGRPGELPHHRRSPQRLATLSHQ